MSPKKKHSTPKNENKNIYKIWHVTNINSVYKKEESKDLNFIITESKKWTIN